MNQRNLITACALPLVGPMPLMAQKYAPGKESSSNMHLIAHLMDGSNYRIGDLEIEQELSRPYAYLATRKDYAGFDIVNLKEPAKAYIMYRWRIENPELHMGGRGQDTENFKTHARYSLMTPTQSQP